MLKALPNMELSPNVIRAPFLALATVEKIYTELRLAAARRHGPEAVIVLHGQGLNVAEGIACGGVNLGNIGICRIIGIAQITVATSYDGFQFDFAS